MSLATAIRCLFLCPLHRRSWVFAGTAHGTVTAALVAGTLQQTEGAGGRLAVTLCAGGDQYNMLISITDAFAVVDPAGPSCDGTTTSTPSPSRRPGLTLLAGCVLTAVRHSAQLHSVHTLSVVLF